MSPSSSRIRWTEHSQPPQPESNRQTPRTQPSPTTSPHPALRPATPFLDKIGRDITQLARESRLKPLFGRQKELLQLQRILLRKEKNSPLLIGAPGVGKTALVEGLAAQIAAQAVATELHSSRIVEIAPSALVADTGLRGTLESRMQTLIAEARACPNLLLFIDEIHTLVRAGAVLDGALDVANILKPALARGEIHCIGATTPDEYDRYLRSDAAFQRRFEVLLLEEPGENETIEILNAARPTYEVHHSDAAHTVQILPQAIQAAVQLSSQHVLDRYQPDKALDLLDDACTLVRLPDLNAPRQPGETLIVDEEIVARALAEKLGVPAQKLSQDVRSRLSSLEDRLNQRIAGQALAAAHITAAMQAAFSGLGRSNRPKSVLAFLGSSGVGKTATAKALSELLFDSPEALIRLDMSEYKEAHTVARLFGSPPGYAGYNDEAGFASRLRRQPFTVVLLDEFEKAHAEIHDAFLQVFDEGRFTDARGRSIEARHAVFILTSNLFTLHKINSPEEYQQHAAAIRQSMSGLLRPEFVNRIDEIVLFSELQPAVLAEIARKEIEGLNQRLARYQVSVRPSQEALDWIAQEAYDPNSGARAVLRLISQLVFGPISTILMQNDITEGQIFDLSLIAGYPRIQTGG
ncbi:MAG: ATP-dependent Clp protease ATP-binding subunit [Chloroflexota bacterium]